MATCNFNCSWSASLFAEGTLFTAQRSGSFVLISGCLFSYSYCCSPLSSVKILTFHASEMAQQVGVLATMPDDPPEFNPRKSRGRRRAQTPVDCSLTILTQAETYVNAMTLVKSSAAFDPESIWPLTFGSQRLCDHLPFRSCVVCVCRIALQSVAGSSWTMTALAITWRLCRVPKGRMRVGSPR